MDKHGVLYIALGLLLGACLTMGVWIGTGAGRSGTDGMAFGQTAMGNGSILVATGRIQGRGDGDGFYIYDTENKKLAVLFVGNSKMELLHIRDMSYDWQPVQYDGKGRRQDPSVKDMKKGTRSGK